MPELWAANTNAAPPTVQLPGTTFGNAAAITATAEVAPPQSRSHLVILGAAGLLAMAAVAVAITVVLLRHSGDAPSLTPVRITATASSTKASDGSLTYWAANVLDGNLATGWCEGTPYDPGIGEWIRLDFDREVVLASVRLTPGYFKTQNLWVHNNRLAVARFTFRTAVLAALTFPIGWKNRALSWAESNALG